MWYFKYCRLEMILNSSIIVYDELIMSLIFIILWIKFIFVLNFKKKLIIKYDIYLYM